MKFETIHDHDLGAPVRDVAQEAVDATVVRRSRSGDIDLEQSLRDELRSRGLGAGDDTLRRLADDIRAGREVRLGEHDGSID
jgi:hypothetical protein